MKKQEIEQNKIEALKLYLLGTAKVEISKLIKVSEHTLIKWEKQGNWKEMYNEVVQKVAEKAQSDVTKEKERSLKLIHGAEAIIAQKIQSGEIQGINIQALASLIKAKTELLMPKNINQFNYMKQENQYGPTYSLEIISPDDNKNEVDTKPEAVPSVADTPRQEDN